MQPIIIFFGNMFHSIQQEFQNTYNRVTALFFANVLPSPHSQLQETREHPQLTQDEWFKIYNNTQNNLTPPVRPLPPVGKGATETLSSLLDPPSSQDNYTSYSLNPQIFIIFRDHEDIKKTQFYLKKQNEDSNLDQDTSNKPVKKSMEESLFLKKEINQFLQQNTPNPLPSASNKNINQEIKNVLIIANPTRQSLYLQKLAFSLKEENPALATAIACIIPTQNMKDCTIGQIALSSAKAALDLSSLHQGKINLSQTFQILENMGDQNEKSSVLVCIQRLFLNHPTKESDTIRACFAVIQAISQDHTTERCQALLELLPVLKALPEEKVPGSENDLGTLVSTGKYLAKNGFYKEAVQLIGFINHANTSSSHLSAIAEAITDQQQQDTVYKQIVNLYIDKKDVLNAAFFVILISWEDPEKKEILFNVLFLLYQALPNDFHKINYAITLLSQNLINHLNLLFR